MTIITGIMPREIYATLLKDGRVENLGRTYRSLSSAPSQANNIHIKNFIKKERNIHPEVVLELGKQGGYETVILYLERKEKMNRLNSGHENAQTSDGIENILS